MNGWDTDTWYFSLHQRAPFRNNMHSVFSGQFYPKSHYMEKQNKRWHPTPITEQEMQTKMFLTVQETAFILRVSVRTVYNMVSTLQLQSVQVSPRKRLIPKESIMAMAKALNSQNKSMFTTRKVKNPSSPGSSDAQSAEESKSVSKKHRTCPTIPKQTVKGSFSESIQGEVYTMAEICAKFNYTYGRFYNLRLRHEIPCVKGQSTKCFPKDIVDRVMAEEAERMGKAKSEDWYTCFDIMKLYGLGKTQVRRFAETHGVRIRKAGKHFNQYLKADWEAARKEAEAKSTSTKSKRSTT